MSIKDELFFPGWWKYAITGFAMGLVIHMLCAMLCGCTSAVVSEPAYPEYDKWWTGSEPHRSTDLSELGQGTFSSLATDRRQCSYEQGQGEGTCGRGRRVQAARCGEGNEE